MTTYERVRYRPEDGKARTVILQDPTEADMAVLGRVLVGVEVDREGSEVAPRGVDERRHIISLDLISKRTPLVMDKTYGELVELPTSQP